jgi:hypothetical protein
VPVVVAHHDLAGLGHCYALGHPGEELIERAHARKIDAGAPAGIVQVPVGEPRRDGTAAGVDDARRGPDVVPHAVVRADGDEPAAAHGEGLGGGETLVHREHLAVQHDQIRG